MLDHEYDTMRRVEDSYWWYRVLRKLTADALLRELNPGPFCILDAGCGTGGTLDVLRESSPAWHLHGFDFSPLAVTHSKARGFASIQSGSVNAIPEPDAMFDAVVSLDVLCCGGVDVGGAMKEFHRVLKPGGILVLNLPAFPMLRGRHDIAVNSVRRFVAGEVRNDLLASNGFEPVSVFYWNAWLFPPIFAWRQITRVAARNENQTEVESDLSPLPSLVNTALTTLGRLESRLCEIIKPPFGTSVFSVARKRFPS